MITPPHLAWALLALLSLTTLSAAVGPRLAQLRADPYGFAGAYDRLGISSRLFAVYFASVELLFALLFITVGLFIFWRGSRDKMAVLVSAAFIGMAMATPLADALPASHPGWRLPVLLLRASGIGLMMLFLYLFPDGRFVPRWSRWLGLFTVLYLAAWFVDPRLVPPMAVLAEATDAATARQYLPLSLLTFLGIVGQIYRYRHVSDALQRQQTKWVVMGITGFIVVEAASLVLFALIPAARDQSATQLLFVILFGPLLLAGAALIPTATAVAILRYHLWDISILVRRTLTYAILTSSLALAYFSSVTVLQRLFATASDQQSPAAIVLSTLVIAALFAPLRRRIQTYIDRRFNRRNYDAARILAAFSQTARDEVDLERLQAALLAVVRETMQPDRAWLWLKPAAGPQASREAPRQSSGVAGQTSAVGPKGP
jgi:hypothetical protein